MIKIIIPNNNINERKYIIDILFNEFLGLEYSIEIIENSKNYSIVLENKKKLMFQDCFFNKFQKDLQYLEEVNIPKKVKFVINNFIIEKDIPVIYGTDKLIIDNQKSITCGIDIFASSFYMLTRWEEYVNKIRDEHSRFPAYASLACKNNFLDRPIVNEYVEMLWNMLKYLGINDNRKEREFKLLLTHDVDVPLNYTSLKSTVRVAIGDIIKRKNIKLALDNFLPRLKVHLGIEKDPFDTFDYLMDISEKVGTKSYFFFMGSGQTKFDNYYKINDGFIHRLIEKIKKKGHYIGIHPTYNAYIDLEQFKKEKVEVEENLDTQITFGREHYLRFEVPTTWQIWEDCKMEWDSTLCYADKEGFRCGVCYEYSVFNILTRKQLKLKEKPLVVMECSFVTYQPNITSTTMEIKIKELLGRVKKYNGEFVFLWHNSNFNTPKWKKYQDVYKNVLKIECGE